MRLRTVLLTCVVLGAAGCEDDPAPVGDQRPIMSTSERGHLLGITDGVRWDKLLGLPGGAPAFDVSMAESVCVNLHGGTFEIRYSSYEPHEEWWCNDVTYVGDPGPVDHNQPADSPSAPAMVTATVPATVEP